MADFYKQMIGDWKADPVETQLIERLQQYYDETPDHLSHKDALIKWKEFREWARAMGYTSADINRVKRNYKFKID